MRASADTIEVRRGRRGWAAAIRIDAAFNVVAMDRRARAFCRWAHCDLRPQTSLFDVLAEDSHPEVRRLLTEPAGLEVSRPIVLQSPLGWMRPMACAAHAVPSPDGGLILLCTVAPSPRRGHPMFSGAPDNSEWKFRRVTETIDDVFWISDCEIKSGVYVSPAYEKIWGRTIDSFYANPRSFVEAIHAEDIGRASNVLEKQALGLPFQHEYRIVRPDGGVRWIWDRGFPIAESDGAVRYFVGLAQDVTDRKLMEAALAESRRIEALGQIAGELAHEFNNIFGSIHLALGEVSEGAGSNQIARAAERGARLTGSLLAVARQEALDPRPWEIGRLIEDHLSLLQEVAGGSSSVRLELGGREPAVAHIDADAFLRAVTDLVLNAAEAYSWSQAPITISCEICELGRNQPALAAAGLDSGRYAVISVRDTGKGMAPSVVARAFEPFFTSKQSGFGAGLGLSAAYSWARQSGGTADVSSVLGQGTCVRLILPTVASAPVSRPRVLASGRGRRVLIVDDEAALLDGIARFLAKHDYDVRTAPCSTEGLIQLENGECDLLLTDICMRGMTGLELAQRAADRWPELAIVLMTGFAAPATASSAPWPVLQKPIAPDRLLEAVRTALDADVSFADHLP